MILATERLELVCATPERLRADLAGPAALATALAVMVPDNWPPDLYDRRATEWALRYAEEHPARLQWGMYYVIDPAAPGGAAAAGIVGGGQTDRRTDGQRFNRSADAAPLVLPSGSRDLGRGPRFIGTPAWRAGRGAERVCARGDWHDD